MLVGFVLASFSPSTYLRGTWCDAVGIYEAAFLAAPHYAHLFDPPTAARCMASDAEALSRDGVHTSYETVRFTYGRLHELELGKLRLSEPSGALAGLIGLSLDVTERRAAEERLRLLASVFETAQEGVMITDAEGAILDVNPSFTRITGHERGEVLGRNPRLLSSGRQRPEFYEEMWATLLWGQVFRGTLVNRSKTGEFYFAEQTITPMRDEARSGCPGSPADD